MSKGRTGIHKQGGLNVQGDKRKYQRKRANIWIAKDVIFIKINILY